MRALLATALIVIATPCFAQNMDVRAYDDAFVLGQRSAQSQSKEVLPPVSAPVEKWTPPIQSAPTFKKTPSQNPKLGSFD